MPSKLKSKTARANGAKSSGPKTAAGRQKSSQNSLTHGLSARHVTLLACEDPAEFQKMVDYYTATYKPATGEEQDQLDDMIDTRWRVRRIGMIQATLLDVEMIRREPELGKEFSKADLGVQ